MGCGFSGLCQQIWLHSIHHTVHSQEAKRPDGQQCNSRSQRCSQPWVANTTFQQLSVGEHGKAAVLCHRQPSEREREGVSRESKKKICHLKIACSWRVKWDLENMLFKQQAIFFSLHWAPRKSAAGSQSFELITSNQSCSLCFLSPSLSFESRAHTENRKNHHLLSLNTLVWRRPPPLWYFYIYYPPLHLK